MSEEILPVTVSDDGRMVLFDFTHIPEESLAVAFFPLLTLGGLKAVNRLFGQDGKEELMAKALISLENAGYLDIIKMCKKIVAMQEWCEENEKIIN